MFRTLFMAFTFGACVLSLTLQTTSAVADDQSLVTIVATDDPQTQLEALILTMQSADQGEKAHVFLCGLASGLAFKEAPHHVTASQKLEGMNLLSLMQKLMTKGVTFEVCSVDLLDKAEGRRALLDGVAVVEPRAMVAKLTADGVRLLSFLAPSPQEAIVSSHAMGS